MGTVYYVYDGDSSHAPSRPTVDDLGGSAKQDDRDYPPDPVTMPCAADANQINRVVAGMAQVTAVAVISVAFPVANTPTIVSLSTPGRQLTFSSFTVVQNAVGDISISWGATALPALNAQPLLTVNDTDTDFNRQAAKYILATRTVRVVTKNNGTGVNVPFTVVLI